MEKHLLNFNRFFKISSEKRVNEGRIEGFRSFKSLNEASSNRPKAAVVGDNLASFFNSIIARIFDGGTRAGGIDGDKIKPGIWSSGNISTPDYLKMIEQYKDQHPDMPYVFLSLGLGDKYQYSEQILEDAKDIKTELRRIFPNASKFFIIPGSGWGYNTEDKAEMPAWMWESGNMENGATVQEPSEINEYYKEIWDKLGFDRLPVRIGIKKGKDKFAEPLSKSTPEMEKLTEFIDGVIKGEIPVQVEDIASGEIVQGLDTDASTREFYDVIQNAINNNETKTKQRPSNYTYDAMVERVQIGLKFLGFDLPIHGADGLYGPETERSVSDFKRKYNVTGEGSVMDLAFLSSLIARLRENGFSGKDLSKVVQGSQDMAGSDIIVGDTRLGDGETSWVYWLSHNQGSAGAAELLKVALGSKPEFSSSGKQWFMQGWNNKKNHIVGNVGNRGWDGEYKTRIKAAYDQGNDQLVAKLFTEYQKKKFDQMLERGRRDLPKHPKIKAIFQKYANVFPLDFLAAVASQESGFNPESGNNRYKGLFALDPIDSDYAKKYGLTPANVYDPEKNTEVAVKFWNDNRKLFNSLMSSNELAALGLNKSSSNMA